MAGERKYYDPSVIFMDSGEKIDAPSVTPERTLIAATPIKKDVPTAAESLSISTIPVERPQDNIPEVVMTRQPIETPEGKMSDPVLGGQRTYYKPEDIFEPETQTVATEPKDQYQNAIMGGMSAGSGVQGQGKPSDNEDIQMFQWSPKTATSGVGQQELDASTRLFKTVLDDQMASMGTTAADVLKTEYDTAFTDTMKGAGVPVYPAVPSLENIQKYNQEMSDYNTKLSAARAKGIKAISDRKSKLAEDSAKWADNIAKENSKVIGKDGELLYDPTKRDVANHILVNEKAIDKTAKHIKEAGDDVYKLAALVPTVAFETSIARNPEAQPSQFSIEEAKAVIGRLFPDASKEWLSTVGSTIRDQLLGKLLGAKVGDGPLIREMQRIERQSPGSIAKMLEQVNRETKELNAISRSSYIRGSKTTESPIVTKPEEIKPIDVKNTDFENPNNPDKVSLVFNSMLRWMKRTQLTPEEERLGVDVSGKSKSGSNQGVQALQQMLKDELGASKYAVTGVPSADDESALRLLLAKNPGMSAKDVIQKAMEYQIVGGGEEIPTELTQKTSAIKTSAKKVGVRRKATLGDFK